MDPLRKAIPALAGARPYDLRLSYVTLLIYEGLPITEIARRAGHTAATCLEVYAQVFDELDYAQRVPAEDAIRAAREAAVSAECPPLQAAN